MVITQTQILTWLGQYILPLMRISAFFFAMPLIGGHLVPMRIRIILSLAITLLIAPHLPDDSLLVDAFSLQAVLLVINQVIIGLAMGFLVQLFFHAFTMAGQLIALQNGLGLSILLNPIDNTESASLSQFFMMLASLLYLLMNGHLALIQMLADSFQTLPAATSALSAQDFHALALQGSWLFESAVFIALPAILALLLMNIGFGVMTRAAPQLNIMNVGFPLMLVTGLWITWLTLQAFLPQFNQLAAENFDQLKQLIR